MVDRMDRFIESGEPLTTLVCPECGVRCLLFGYADDSDMICDCGATRIIKESE